MPCSGTTNTPTISATPSPNFLDLPLKIRNNIYKQVLAIPHPLHIFQDPGCPLEAFAPEKPCFWLALTCVNRLISNETRKILYSVTQFTLQEMETTCHQGTLLESFLNCIGATNSGILSHLCVNFPAIERLSGASGEIRLTEHGLRRLLLLRQSCTGLKTLEILIFGQLTSNLFINDQINEFARKIFLEVDAQIRGIAPLNTIVVRIYTSSIPPVAVREFLQRLGWTVKLGDA
ncbi:hypothetical protein ASPBRDRAFT_43432 [Aspergillus brasiliensis CBS 101740]|uniref:F-box domain-containing protein n=1 Tax=Aspergillus brasiliensis (strain CBS 101740 / IMI 381727 / IBT 21946) TaxID=767769 RepID=A0A1L9UK22_ASPBC|nr:hypothetical protein ASPBRDRAFT_43432 [Aspergillus brasiliensis CBS 101740]